MVKLYYPHICYHTCPLCTTESIKKTQKTDRKKLKALREYGHVIMIRGCQWNLIKDHLTMKSPYSSFYYNTSITTDMILQAVKNGTFFGLLEVDVSTPMWLQRECNKINFATIFNKITPTEDMLSSSMLARCQKYGTKFPLNPQLTLVYNAKQYLITSDMLKYYLELGMTVSCVHYCVEFQRSKPLNKFIELSKTTTTDPNITFIFQ